MENVILYTHPDCAQCALTKTALQVNNIAFTERSAAEYAQALGAKGISTTPVIAVAVEAELIVWQGHRPDLIELLADLIDLGPVSVGGLRDVDEAQEAVVTRAQAMEEIRRHQVNAEDFFAEHGNHPLYRGAVLLGWLGY